MIQQKLRFMMEAYLTSYICISVKKSYWYIIEHESILISVGTDSCLELMQDFV